MYSYFANFINFYANRETGQYKFKILFEGTELPTNRKERFENAIKLASNGMFLPQKIAASIGMKPNDFKNMLEQTKNENWEDLFVTLVNINTVSGNAESKGGRPRSDELTDSGLATRDNASNIEKGGEI